MRNKPKVKSLTTLWLLAVGSVLAWGGPAVAGCGAMISAACTITAGGYYAVTADFSANGTNNGITINASLGTVVINLNGWAISQGTGTGTGINGGSATNVSIVGPGVISGFKNGGISLGEDAVVSNVQAISSGGDGISVGNDSGVINCIEDGGTEGISLGNDSSVMFSIAESNSGDGIYIGNDSAVIANSSNRNGGYGLNNPGTNARFAHNQLNSNTSGCVEFYPGSTADNNDCNGTID